MQPDLLPELIQTWPDTMSGHCHLALALSGGLDSMVLLDLLCRWRDEAGGPAFTAIHVHHGISVHADDWLHHCQIACEARGVPLHAERVHIGSVRGRGVEAAARAARYQVFAASPANVLALAHHADDQSETVLLQLLRGGGVKALAAMPLWRSWQGKHLWRPLLDVPRARLALYAANRGLRWVDDDSNQDAAHYLRNHLRLHVLPGLRQRQSGLDTRLARSAALMADAAAILDEVAALDLAQLGTSGGKALSLTGWRCLSQPRQRHVLLHWLTALAWPAPSPAALLGLQAALQAGRDARLDGEAGVLIAYRDQLLALPWGQAPRLPCSCVPGLPLQLGGGELGWVWQAGGLPALPGQVWHLRARLAGEMLRQDVGRKPLKKLFQEAGVPAILRAHWPVLCDANGTLLAVPGVAVAADHAAEAGWWPLWRPLSVFRGQHPQVM